MLENSLAASYKIKHTLTAWSSNHTPWCFIQRSWKLCPHKYLHTNGYNQFSSVAQSCPTLCDPMNCSTPGLPVHHHLLEFTQTHVHRVSDAIPPSPPLSSPFSSHLQSFPESGSFQMSQFFTSDGLKYCSFSFSITPSNEHPGLISFRMDWLDFLQSKVRSKVFSNTPIQKH